MALYLGDGGLGVAAEFLGPGPFRGVRVEAGGMDPGGIGVVLLAGFEAVEGVVGFAGEEVGVGNGAAGERLRAAEVLERLGELLLGEADLGPDHVGLPAIGMDLDGAVGERRGVGGASQPQLEVGQRHERVFVRGVAGERRSGTGRWPPDSSPPWSRPYGPCSTAWVLQRAST